MLDIKFIRENADAVKVAAVDKRIKCDVDRLVAVDLRRRELQVELEGYRGKVKESGQLLGLLRNPKSAGYKQAVAAGKSEADIQAETERLQAELGEIKPKIKTLEEEEGPILEEFDRLMPTTPQPPDEGVPVGKDDTENVELRTVGGLTPGEFSGPGLTGRGIDVRAQSGHNPRLDL